MSCLQMESVLLASASTEQWSKGARSDNRCYLMGKQKLPSAF